MTMTIYSGNTINPMLNQATQEKVFQRADINADGQLSAEEFTNFTTSADNELSESNRNALFNELDTDGNGALTSDEITDGKAEALNNLQEALRGLNSLKSSQEALQNLVGGVSMMDFLQGNADINSALGLGDWSDIIGNASSTESDTNKLIANLLAEE